MPFYIYSITAIAFVLSCAGIRTLLGSRIVLGLLDIPNERSLHSRPVPRAGGLVILLTVVVCALIAWLALGLADRLCSGVLLIAVGLAVFSLIDDRKGLPVLLRLFIHLAAAVCLIWLIWLLELAGRGTVLPAIGVPGLLALMVATGWMTNLFNFMDGSDGLAGGMAAFGFGSLAVFAGLASAYPLAALCAAIASASVGFLVFNWPPARVFMGDAGSIPLGFLAAAAGIVGWVTQVWPLMVPVIVFSPFWVDASVTLMRRALRGQKVWQAHREHYYQRLILLGWSHRRTAIAYYAAMSVCAIIAGFIFRRGAMTLTESIVICGLLAVAYLFVGAIVDYRWLRFNRTERGAAAPK